MRRDILTEITIPASRAEVWARLADLSGWKQWNPLVPDAAGDLETGARLRLLISLPGRRQRAVYPEVMRVLPREELSWVIRLQTPGLLDCEHRFLLEPPDNGNQDHTLLVQRARLSGILLPLFWRRLRPALSEGFQQSNRALRSAVLIS